MFYVAFDFLKKNCTVMCVYIILFVNNKKVCLQNKNVIHSVTLWRDVI